VSDTLAGKVAIITGAARGQGAAEARLFAAEGARVVITDILDDLGKEVADEIGDSASFLHQDVSDPEAWQQVQKYVDHQFGRLDVLINNAAIHHLCSIEAETVEGFDRIVSVNLKGTFLGIQSSIAPMRESGGGSIINISSLAGIRPFVAHGAYSSAKYGVTGLTQVAALELAQSGIRVNSIHPGPIDTDMLPDWQRAAERSNRYPLKRVGTPSEVAELALFLASDASSYITGAAVPVDGGCGLL
jgi:3alpha(or 20beta)-hydroxysteroid dehydrogenase